MTDSLPLAQYLDHCHCHAVESHAYGMMTLVLQVSIGLGRETVPKQLGGSLHVRQSPFPTMMPVLGQAWID